VGEKGILGSQNSNAELSNSYSAIYVIPYISILKLISAKSTIQAHLMYPIFLCSALHIRILNSNISHAII